MMPVHFEGANTTFHKPSDMTDEQCMSVSAYVGRDSDNLPFVLTAWQPSHEDIQAINAGRPIMLKLVGVSMQPAALYTFDHEYNPNV